MTEQRTRGRRVAVVGGSIAGCAAALAARRAGADAVTLYERAPGRLGERGMGVAVHAARYAELAAAGYLDAAIPWVQMERRHWYVRDAACPDPLGRRIAGMDFPFRTYNWGSLWHELRGRMPAGTEVRSGTPVTAVVRDGDRAEVRTAAGAESYDLVVGADGHRSVVRGAAFAEVAPRFAGYPAWRGAFPAERLPDAERWPVGSCAYVVFPGGHLIVYRIPSGPADPAGHRVNWVLYTAPSTGLTRAPGDPDAHEDTLDAARCEQLARFADAYLPPYWATLLKTTARAELAVQTLYDFTAPRYTAGPLLLLGDAATVARPHTGAGAVKALQDASALERALTGTAELGAALDAYDGERAPTGRTLVDLGRRLGDALVSRTPDWSALDQQGLEEWWQRADGSGAFGGGQLRR
ncbi:FAD-dependent monooxygenase [Streptomyces cavernicola]|uniref:FAD-dependent monooxygenase n=1 Tax=Streptomyces cavernicola TaxID=3043613 RepID=A0ABT6SCD0_9ACTN|nr:FAD-dependent monooxygenase [Streptomyces sp. B-S-A6]MDI3405307.1 FAD-dependent monooxygenase [Streptomyces sp. B-S-A6]